MSTTASEQHPSVLLVDDDATLRERLGRAFRERGWEVTTAADYEAALVAARRESPEYAVVDLRMPGHSGLELVRDLLAVDAATRIVVLTGYGSIATTVDAIRLGAVNYLPKPADVDDILAAFARATHEPAVAAPETLQAPSLARAEWEHIHRVLADSAGNISEAARKLGIHRRSLQRKLQKYPPSR
ncbi:two-component system response regulator [Corallococcus sp. H22C18031201]|uniref:response regulator transcription factor n=1 Tax=Citreicoccus inhibens TaxID=2849499 RepID=UPI000E74C8ED|nr:response regulator [Citreicoccus inhibens]MBU8897924.1 response regulator [Citreicoccus inhibens]RJS21738.1 two-component system response regulator [Corallococcus sp. H22C18031201]